jgi:hypothetical protein
MLLPMLNEFRWARWILIGICAFLVFCLVSCSAQKQLARVLKRHPELVNDTSLIDYDTTIFHVPSVRKDSVVHIKSFMTDTIYLKQDRLSVKTYVYNDSVYIEGECDEITDTVFSVERIPYKQIVYPEDKFEWWKWLLIGFVVYLVLKDLFYARKRGFHTGNDKGSEDNS